MRRSSVVLLSGGLDSAANLALCSESDQPVLCLTIDYGQRAAKQELSAARQLALYYDVPHEVLDLRWLGSLGGSSLTEQSKSLPTPTLERLDDPVGSRETARAVWVPNRNGVLINAAAAHAERKGAEQVIVGFNLEEAATFPDNSTEFIKQSTQALSFSTANHVRVHCYTDKLKKPEIVRKLKGLSRPFPFEKLWSCYQGFETPCWSCESCQRLKRALEEGGALR